VLAVERAAGVAVLLVIGTTTDGVAAVLAIVADVAVVVVLVVVVVVVVVVVGQNPSPG